MNVEHVIPERDALCIAQLINICREERRTILNHFTPEDERAYLESMGPSEAVFVSYENGEFLDALEIETWIE